MQGEPNYSSQIAYEIDKEVQRIVKNNTNVVNKFY